MKRALRLLGAVLAGGEGRRFGGPKDGARIAGVPMAARAVALVRSVVGDVVLVTGRPLAAPPAPIVLDRVRAAGPLGGLDAALRHAREGGFAGVLLVACDLPLLTPEVLQEVAGALEDHTAVAPARRGGGIEPLCAAYRVEVLEAVERRLGAEDRSLHALFHDVGGYVLSLGAAPADAFLNVNTLEELERAEEALRSGGEP